MSLQGSSFSPPSLISSSCCSGDKNLTFCFFFSARRLRFPFFPILLNNSYLSYDLKTSPLSEGNSVFFLFCIVYFFVFVFLFFFFALLDCVADTHKFIMLLKIFVINFSLNIVHRIPYTLGLSVVSLAGQSH